MKFENIEEVWKKQKATDIYKIDEDALRKNIKNKSRWFDLIITIRDAIEIILPFSIPFVVIYLGFVFFPEKIGGTWIDYWYLYIFQVPIVFAGAYFLKGRLDEKQKVKTYDNTVLAEVDKILYKTKRQIKVVDNLLVFNLLPGISGICLIIYFLSPLFYKSGQPVLPVNIWLIYSITAVLAIIMVLIYKYPIRKKLVVKEKEIEAVRKSLT